MRAAIGLALWALTVGVVAAQAGPDEPEVLLAIKAARLIDGTGAPPSTDVFVVVHQGQVRTVGTRRPTGAQVIDLGNVTLMPGFVDAHTHLTGPGRSQDDAVDSESPQADAIRGVRHARLALEAGFTTVRDVGADHDTDVALRDMIAAGVVPGPRMQVATRPLGAWAAYCDDHGALRPAALEDPAAAVRERSEHGADWIKIWIGDGVGVSSPAELALAVETAHGLGHRVAAHAIDAASVAACVDAGVDSVEHGWRLDDDAADSLRESGAFLVPTLAARRLAGTPPGDDVLAKAITSGVRVALGSGAGLIPHGTQAEEFVALVDAGMAPLDAIVAGTRTSAELLGLEDQVGTVERGKVADLVAVRGNPLDDIRRMSDVVFVMQAGEVILDRSETKPDKKEKKAS